ncbi:MAG: DNA starvation/stationary phase protection protein [Bacteriovoracaceae bacterium]|nr:DNA starvation/stationary phase protection protein [Bacteriovoracaceae bacterium]
MNNFETLRKRAIGDISEEDVTQIADFMNNLLANEYALFTKALNYHWNITGPRFNSLHQFLEDSYKNLLIIMDETAERIRVLGETPMGTVEKFNSTMKLKEHNAQNLSSSQMLADMLESNLIIQNDIKGFLRKEELLRDDPGSEDFLVSTLRKHEDFSWMLKSHLE